MPSFTLTARVVLHKDDARTEEHSPDADEYETLHAEMRRRDYRRYFINQNDEMKKLPPGLYRIKLKADDWDDASSKAMKKAKEAATIATSKNRFSIVITGGDGVRGVGLETITEDPDEDTLIDP
ncbi:hypothetical protein [Burkholderia gladioli]|uniref:hypothetical protein n=1 Tax=Burkholderia gladioli TaxID=28095 RepID=UPI00163E41CF|nr:hypothetical protein [Burkholderia gladioli]